MFIQIKDLLPREFNRHGLKKEVAALDVINLFNKSAGEFFSKDVLACTIAKVYKEKKLYVEAASSSASQSLFLKQSYIMEKINSLAGKRLVEKIIIKTLNN